LACPSAIIAYTFRREVAPMEESRNPEEEELLQPSTWDKLLSSPDIQKAIAQIPDLFKANLDAKNEVLKAQLESQTGTTKGMTKWILVWSIVLAILIIGPVTALSWSGKISSDAATFLFGTLVGAAFTFLRNFFPKGS